jgi:phosphatidylethanolamine/phosphatidyl-N-methylethanolamine N-methyltransferase
MKASYYEFLIGLLRDPCAVAAPTPSGRVLAQAIAAKVDPMRPGLVLELGPGTGVVTEALLERGIASDRILAIEHSSYFAKLFADRFSDVKVVLGDAFAFEKYLPDRAQIAAVVCGVPLLNFSVATRRSLIVRALAAQGPAGRFIQLSYGWNPPVETVHDEKPARTFVWQNLPPAHVWVYSANVV